VSKRNLFLISLIGLIVQLALMPFLFFIVSNAFYILFLLITVFNCGFDILCDPFSIYKNKPIDERFVFRFAQIDFDKDDKSKCIKKSLHFSFKLLLFLAGAFVFNFIFPKINSFLLTLIDFCFLFIVLLIESYIFNSEFKNLSIGQRFEKVFKRVLFVEN
jgi:hypothetical protein